MDVASAIGVRLAIAGAETYRVEECVIRILRAYGYEAKVYFVPNSLFVSIQTPDGPPITCLSRIGHHGNDLNAVEQYSNLSRRICSETPKPEEALKWIENEVKNLRQYNLLMRLLGCSLVASGFCIFFGGSLQDALCAGVCGVVLGVFTRLIDKVGKINVFFHEMSTAFVLALTSYALCALGLTTNVDTTVIGTLMLLVPGLLFTNAIRDIIFGDTNSGINKIVTVLLIAAAVAMGTAAAWEMSTNLWGVPEAVSRITHSPCITCFVSFIACVGFVIVFNIHGYGNMLCALGGGLTWATYCIVAWCGGGEYLCCFAATVFAAAFAELMARIRKYPAISYLVISLLPLIPGAGIYYAAKCAIQGDWGGTVNYGMNTLLTAGVMAIGIVLVSSSVRVITENHRNTCNISSLKTKRAKKNS